jgi:hypothetical protein
MVRSISRVLRMLALPCALPFAGCADDSITEADDSDDFEAYDHAVLKLYEPVAGSVHHVGEPLPAVAELLDLDGFPLPIKEVVWRSDHVDHVLLASMQGEVVLPIGVHEVGATVRLPNGNRLAASVGGVRVQSPATGVYVGETVLRLELEFEGQTVRPACIAGLAFTVDMAGERLQPQAGSCTLELIVFSFDLEYELSGTIEGETVHGTIRYDVGGLFMLPFEFEGRIANGVFSAQFAGDVGIPLVGDAVAEGSLNAKRVTQLVE